MLSPVLDPVAERQLADGRELLAELRASLAAFPAADADTATLGASIRQLDDFFLLVVVGEFNAGKSAFINALLGERVLEEGVTPTTAQIHLVEHGPEVSVRAGRDGIRVVTSPLDLLHHLHIVDTPGTNAVLREHERLTADFVPRSDFVLFVTSADRPFTDTERVFLESIRGWGKKVVLVVNKIDILDQASEVEQVLAFVREQASRLLGLTPEVFPVSARLAWRARQGDASTWAASRFEALERYLRDTLDEASRFRLKLANPLGVGDALAGRYAAHAADRLVLLADDVAAIEDVERQLAVFREDVRRGFELRMTAVEKVLLELESRGHQYFEDTIRVGRVFDLLNRARVQREFEEKVVATAPQEVERRVSELIDWLVDQDFRQWQGVTERLSARLRASEPRLLGSATAGGFQADRARLLDSVGREARRVVETYDRRREAQAIADAARNSVAATAAIGAGALGLGAIVSVAATTAAADVTGLLMAGVLTAVGFFVIPARRRQARGQMQAKISALRARLAETLRLEFERAQAHSVQRLDQSLAPYTRFVRAEQRRWQALRDQLAGVRDRVRTLLAAIEPVATPAAPATPRAQGGSR
jgi:small GTP-binding protein